MVDFFGKVPDIVIDKILENLSFRMAAQTSVLSKQWRRAWLSLDNLDFDSDFWDEQKSSDWQKWSRIISNILLNHNGLVREFYLRIPFDPSENCMISYSQWISFLSKNGIKKISIINQNACRHKIDITSNIFWCRELVYLKLVAFNLHPPPTDFTGFRNLETLVLVVIHFTKPNILQNLIENCKSLATLRLEMWSGMDHVVIDSPSLQTLILSGDFESLAFKNLRNLKRIILRRLMMRKLITVETIDAINLLARSCQLQYILFDDYFFKYFAVGGIERSSSVTFNHLDELCLTGLNLSDVGVFHDLLSMLKCCPYIKKLYISVVPRENIGQHILDFNHNFKLDHLLEIKIKGITGTRVELKLVQYLLAISPVLEDMFFYSGICGIESELKMSRALMGFPRASPKAGLFFPGGIGSLNPPPADFTGFPNLRSLSLGDVHFNTPNVFRSLSENCKMLETLQLIRCFGIDHVVLDLPRLHNLKLMGDFESLAFKNVRSLRSISLLSFGTSTMPKKLLSVETCEYLANSCQLQSITFDDHLLKFFVAGGIIKSSSVTFNHLKELCLGDFRLSEFGVLRDLLSMIKCCPYIMKLELLDIFVISSGSLGQDIVDFNYDYKLNYLREVIIEGITGSSAELKLVECLLAISTVLENLSMKCGKRGIESEPKILRALMGFPRASSKARLLFLDK